MSVSVARKKNLDWEWVIFLNYSFKKQNKKKSIFFHLVLSGYIYIVVVTSCPFFGYCCWPHTQTHFQNCLSIVFSTVFLNILWVAKHFRFVFWMVLLLLLYTMYKGLELMGFSSCCCLCCCCCSFCCCCRSFRFAIHYLLLLMFVWSKNTYIHFFYINRLASSCERQSQQECNNNKK